MYVKQKHRAAVAAVVAEIERQMEVEDFGGCAPRLRQFEARKKNGVPTPRALLTSMGIEPNADGWKKFVKTTMKISVVSEEVILENRSKQTEKINKAKSNGSDTGNSDNWTKPGINHGLLDTLPTTGMPVSSVRVDEQGRKWYMLR